MVARKFRKQPERAIVSFDFLDIASGTGIKNFYGGVTVDKNLLSTQLFWSDVVGTTAATGTQSSATQIFDKDFDVLINNPLTIRGQTVVNVPMRVKHEAGTAGANAFMKVNILIRKVDLDSVETTIVENISSEFNSGTQQEKYFVGAVDVDIPKTKFKSGEILRMSCVGFGRREQDGNYNVSMGHDPKNRSTADDGSNWDGGVSQLLFQVPIKITL